MWLKKLCKSLACAVVGCCLGVTALAADSVVQQKALEHSVPDMIEPAGLTSNIGSRAYGSIGTTISANGAKAVREGLLVNAGETVTFDCTYNPTTASMDFGLIAPDGYFHYINVTGGSINKTIQVEERGTYTVAIMNNSSSDVTVTGTVQY